MIPLTDNPLAFLHEDAYGFRPFVEQLDAAVAQARPLPLTVGVFGAWGTGKSSFLGMWSDLLAEQPRNRQVRFNPWKYDRKVEVWAALLHTILGELKKEERLREKAGRLARAATWLSLRAGLGSAATLATAGIVRPEHVNELLDTFAQNDADEYSQVNTFEDEFAEAVEEFVGPEGRLVVFVDDLDRCTPEAAMTVLESLKLFVGHARCVFVLALDVDVLAAVATNKFGVDLKGAPEEAISGMNYLEKIVQLPFFLPDVEFATLRATLAPYVEGLGGNEAFWELVRVGLGTNPRRVKRFVNVLNLAVAALGWDTGPAETATGGQDPHWKQLQLAELLIIRGQHRAFFRTLTQHPEAWQLLERAGGDMARPGGGRDLALSQLPPYLRPFADDAALMSLLDTRPGGRYEHPPAPGPDEVVRLFSTLHRAAGPLPDEQSSVAPPQPA
ncbi:KAP family P-loop NTPase fold protein [Actinomadura yumaensis]|uniref:P-loop NTPase fold protein n=3 Tax=Actinomadura TaxID=1988 RepID=A0ABW2CZQ4_9ACTN